MFWHALTPGSPGMATGLSLSPPRSEINVHHASLVNFSHFGLSLFQRLALLVCEKPALVSTDGRGEGAQFKDSRCLLSKDLEASSSSPTRLQWAAMTHGEVMHSQAKFIGIRRLSYLQVSCILGILILTHLHVALASFEVELHGVNRKTTTFLLQLASFAELAFIFSQ